MDIWKLLKKVVIAFFLAIIALKTDIQINGVKYELEHLLSMFVGFAMGMWAAGSRDEDLPFGSRGKMPEPKLFTMIRKHDESHISGTGRVLDGVVFHNGKVAICWRTEDNHGYSSLGIYDSFEAFKFIHIDSHPTNETEIVWLESPPLSPLSCSSSNPEL
jgi:hypothetical protein